MAPPRPIFSHEMCHNSILIATLLLSIFSIYTIVLIFRINFFFLLSKIIDL